MDFTFTAEQEALSKLAGALRYDAALWKELAGVDLLGTALPESSGGSCVCGDGFVELAIVLAEVGSTVAPVPAYATLLPTDAPGVEVRPVANTNREPHADVFLDGATLTDKLDGDRLVESRSSGPPRPAPGSLPSRSTCTAASAAHTLKGRL
ncbi:acyl-CoA dehydrogenase family protein [Mycobacterium sp.]|uniref:acyl-CoA dehydrogenase family protein n=1 Tax=Mycobacterium sp. TaxID=1785 RepID=UPI0031DA6606